MLAMSLERNVVVEDGSRIHGYLVWRLEVECHERELLVPHCLQKLLYEFHGEILPGTAAIAESERRIASRVAQRVRFAINYAVDRAKRAVGHFNIAPIFDSKGLLRKR